MVELGTEHVFLGIIIVFGVAIGLMYNPITEADEIPPTDAVKEIEVQTSLWAVNDTLVIADTYNDRFFFVTDGSITFNVTDTPPP